MAALWWIAGIGALLIALSVVFTVYLALVLAWEDRQTVGLGYYGKSQAERDRFKRSLRIHALLLAPILWLNGKLAKVDFRRASVRHKGVAGPAGTTSAETFAQAEAYQPRPDDVFVVTQMKCGTTWMQHVVYEVLHRGAGTIGESGAEMYALAPWLEGRKSVPVEQAPLLGRERPSRIIKTHLPASLCPWSDRAKYIYVARHPVSCFASCMDFVATNVGAMAPALPAYEEWFRSKDLMWWGTWTDHVKGWWERAQAPTVLFVYFEDMKRDLPAIVRRVARFLDVAPLTDRELALVVEKCGFAYMQKHQDNFEMHPPHILQTNAELFVRGSADRHKDVPEEARRRICAWVVAEMAGSTFPLAEKYPDVTATGGAGAGGAA